ncbi:MAG: response regulator [Terracidiphilus sp.]
MQTNLEHEELSAIIADDDEIFRSRLGRALEARGWEVFLAANTTQALSAAQENAPDLAIVDLRLGGENGLDVVRALRPLDPTMSLIMLTGWGSIATALEAVRGGADHYLTKPVDADQIIAAFKALSASGSNTTRTPKVPSLAGVEWEHIQRVIADCEGNISQAARALGIHRRSLQRKLSKYPPAR